MDANCEVQVRDGQSIAFDKQYGIEPIRIGVRGRQVTFTAQNGNSKNTSSIDASSSNSAASYNGLTLRPRMAPDGSVILTISRD